ncbi:hypothetical protein AVEN_77722-1 [Araneus ventricosus]|uniref:Uncharacterized protein n=1 Tax=Araneus ventricosus TaxID=182803 RepID=A0A4Y2QXT1_ARAVE|nr:hypothetical protein AVEN_79532-1 [Araneus ventricosus]GBN68222.1 hypothetical protein AVEN_77722-1 [Araneus ventricosus]
MRTSTNKCSSFTAFTSCLTSSPTVVENKPDPTEWGWFMKDGRLNPVPSTLPAASEELLKLIPCNCKITLTRDSEQDANARRQTFTVQSFVPLCLVETCKNSASPTSGFEDDDDE